MMLEKSVGTIADTMKMDYPSLQTVTMNMTSKDTIKIHLGKCNVPWVCARVSFIDGNQDNYTLGKDSSRSTWNTTTVRTILSRPY